MVAFLHGVRFVSVGVVVFLCAVNWRLFSEWDSPLRMKLLN